MDYNPKLIHSLRQFVENYLGLFFAEGQEKDLLRRTSDALREKGWKDLQTGLEDLLKEPPSPENMALLSHHLTVGETYFYRDPKFFGILKEVVLPELIQKREQAKGSFSLWSAGCASGEEAYTLALLLHKILPGYRTGNLALYGTDVNQGSLTKARKGLYGEWSFRNPPSWIYNFFDTPEKNPWQIHPEIRERVSFSLLNLVEFPYPGPFGEAERMDLILCRNVLMYLSPQIVPKILEAFSSSLKTGGYLVVSPTEGSPLFSQYFHPRRIEGFCFYQKSPDWPKEKEEPREFPFPEGFSLWRDSPADPVALGLFSSSPIPPEEPLPERVPEERDSLSPQKPTVEETFYHHLEKLYHQREYRKIIEEMEDFLSSWEALELMEEEMKFLIRSCANEGNRERALKWLEKALKIHKFNPGLRYLQAVILLEQGAESEALDALKKALYLDPNFILAHFALGNLYLKEKRSADAKRCLQNTLSLLQKREKGEEVPYSDGMSVEDLQNTVETLLKKGG